MDKLHKMNPVFVNGIRRRMRGIRTPVLMAVFFVILLLLFATVYTALTSASNYSYSYYSYQPYYSGRPRAEGMELLLPMYSFLVMGILMLILLLVPALNAGNIASEREKQTLDLLLSSRLSAIKIVLGKIFSNLAFVVLLIMLTLPFFAILFLFGSIMPIDIILIFLFMIVTAYACSSVATFFSSLMKKSAIAVILTYVTLILFGIITLIIGVFLMSMPNSPYSGDTLPMIMRINPFVALFEIIMHASNYGSASSGMLLFQEDSPAISLAISACFMLVVSPLINMASAVLIKPVQKFQI